MNEIEQMEKAASPQTFEEAVDSILTEMRETMIAKQRAYGVGNIAKFGEFGVMVRLSDKQERLHNILNKGGTATHDESLEDTWLDMANYGLIGLMVRRGIWGLPMEDGSA